MKKIEINVPDGMKLSELSLKDGMLLCMYEQEEEKYIPVRGEVVKVLKKGRQIGVAIMEDPHRKTFHAISTCRTLQVHGKFDVEVEFKKANMGDIQTILHKMDEEGYAWNPELLTVLRPEDEYEYR